MKRMAKNLLAEQGINVYIKDIQAVEIHPVTVVSHNVGEGLAPDRFSHRDIVVVLMKDGTGYQILRETVDKDGNFSTNSARFVTREIRNI